MAQENKQHQNQHQNQQQQQQNKKQQNPGDQLAPMIVGRLYRIPMVSMAIQIGYSQYDKLKSSNVTVGEVMTKAEGWAVYVWQKVQPIVEKLQDPINKADKLACDTLDFVSVKLNTVKN